LQEEKVEEEMEVEKEEKKPGLKNNTYLPKIRNLEEEMNPEAEGNQEAKSVVICKAKTGIILPFVDPTSEIR
jgi:hypothetical protein